METKAGCVIRDRYKLLKELGRGNFGRAWLVTDIKCKEQSHKQKVLKVTYANFKSVEDTNDSTHEARLLQELKHPGVIKVFDSFFQLPHFFLATEYAEGGDLGNAIRDHNKHQTGFEEEQIVEWIIQILLAVEYIHSKKIIHRDIKPANIFLLKQRLKVGDFGIARRLIDSSDLATTQIGTFSYMSPELLNGKPYSYGADMWAVGCVLYELVTLRQAFKSMMDLVSLNKHQALPQWPQGFNKDLKAVFERLCTIGQATRASAESMLADPYIVQEIKVFKRRVTDRVRVGKNKPASRNEVLASQGDKAIDEESRCWKNLSPGERMTLRRQTQSQNEKTMGDSCSDDELEHSTHHLPVMTAQSRGRITMARHPVQVADTTAELSSCSESTSTRYSTGATWEDTLEVFTDGDSSDSDSD